MKIYSFDVKDNQLVAIAHGNNFRQKYYSYDALSLLTKITKNIDDNADIRMSKAGEIKIKSNNKKIIIYNYNTTIDYIKRLNKEREKGKYKFANKINIKKEGAKIALGIIVASSILASIHSLANNIIKNDSNIETNVDDDKFNGIIPDSIIEKIPEEKDTFITGNEVAKLSTIKENQEMIEEENPINEIILESDNNYNDSVYNKSSNYDDDIKKASNRWGVSEDLLRAIMMQESGADIPRNLMGIVYNSVKGGKYVVHNYENNKDVTVYFGESKPNGVDINISRNDLNNSFTQVASSAILLQYLYKYYKNNIYAAIAAYNMGQGNVNKMINDANYDLSDYDNDSFMDYAKNYVSTDGSYGDAYYLYHVAGRAQEGAIFDIDLEDDKEVIVRH